MKRLIVAFMLLALLVAIMPVAAQTAPTPISYGETVTGTISDETPSVFYTFEGSIGDVVTITMVAAADSNLDSTVALYTASAFESDGVALAENDDAADSIGIGTFDSRIPNFVLPEDGSYVIEATRFGSSTGDFELTLDTGEEVAIPNEAPTPISYGETVTGTISDETPSVFYTFEGSAGDVVTITMAATADSSLDTTVALYTLENFQLLLAPTIENDDAVDSNGIGSFDSRISDYTLQQDGTYVIEATRFGSSTGDFELTLEAGGADAAPEAVEEPDVEEPTVEEPAFEGAQVIALDDGASEISVIIPEDWFSVFDAPFTVAASSEGALEVFTGSDDIQAPAGEIALAFATPETLTMLAESAEDFEESLVGYMTVFADQFGTDNEIMDYDEFAVPAVMLSVEGVEDAPENTNVFVLELEDDFVLVFSVTGGVYSEFEARIVEVVNSLAGVVPSYATPIEVEPVEEEEPVEETTEETGESTAPDGPVDIGDGLTVTLPDGYVVSSELPFTYAATSDETLTIVEDGIEAPAAGELGLTFIAPSGLVQFELTAESSALEVAETLNTLFQATGTVEAYDATDATAAITFLEESPIVPPGGLIITVETVQGTVIVAVQPGDTFEDVESSVVEIINSITAE